MAVETTDQANAVVEQALASIGDLATLPEVTIKIIEIVENPRSTARELHGVIKNDPALSMKILKVVNSAFYGLPGQIASVDRAIILLGLSAVKNIAIAASIARLFKGKRISEQFSAADLWRHSVAVGVGARALARCSPHPVMPEEIFVAGLIHDIGTLVERQAFPDQFATVIQRCTDEEGLDFLECERQVIGADHQAFGVGLTTKWKFPRHLRASVGFHHNPETLSVELRNMARLIQVADVLACQEQVGFYLTAQYDEITPEMLEALNLTQEQFDEVRATLAEQVSDTEATLSS
ncbi:MAG: HDOD domain-containing protein [Planctomycetes bacterium]|nr:HDOD domain-containing protein [Planctomycetota bacterium]